MEPIEINAGSWYLRALRADDRIDDRPALAEGGITDPGYVARRTAQWDEETHYSWAVCEPTTAELVAEVGVTPGEGHSAEIAGWSRPGYDEALEAGMTAVLRFTEGALGLTPRRAD
ncbi:GNAT family N-acetyltransferase [Nocardia cyriacigeorgica]|uniref:Uncharacterized protein n=1 Tax=Nocardia cyriacigeorgica (strain GUH-2) TaxID=1127134 RepID=H6R2K8_NOCCG|nr:hypothetical protein [Nocardia cyriacigeorgica]BDU04897.1 hypothetical protein FMUBM48_11600 [Nocardia cyriacigeorgica]CCF61858.1 conserved protein of unknown function; putative IMP dehydrogenase domain [Nocardia cyriacigeorgica GUH-2]